LPIVCLASLPRRGLRLNRDLVFIPHGRKAAIRENNHLLTATETGDILNLAPLAFIV
jgi:hypothetical protein